MSNIIPIPEAVPYAGEVSVYVQAQALRQPHGADMEVGRVVFNVDGLPSNVAPHILKRLGLIGMSAEEADVLFTRPPYAGLTSVTREEMIGIATNPGMGKRIWSALEDVVDVKTESGLVVGRAGEIRGDFGFGLEWLLLNHSPLTGRGLAHKILSERAASLGVTYDSTL